MNKLLFTIPEAILIFFAPFITFYVYSQNFRFNEQQQKMLDLMDKIAETEKKIALLQENKVKSFDLMKDQLMDTDLSSPENINHFYSIQTFWANNGKMILIGTGVILSVYVASVLCTKISTLAVYSFFVEKTKTTSWEQKDFAFKGSEFESLLARHKGSNNFFDVSDLLQNKFTLEKLFLGIDKEIISDTVISTVTPVISNPNSLGIMEDTHFTPIIKAVEVFLESENSKAVVVEEVLKNGNAAETIAETLTHLSTLF